jgi:hypothetical protein
MWAIDVIQPTNYLDTTLICIIIHINRARSVCDITELPMDLFNTKIFRKLGIYQHWQSPLLLLIPNKKMLQKKAKVKK